MKLIDEGYIKARGLREQYDSELYEDLIYFSTDTHEIILNGEVYGTTQEALDALEQKIKSEVSETYVSKEELESELYEISANGYEFVDMGEAGIWAKYPIGVTKWDSNWVDKIKYFAWGETEGYTKSQVGVDKQFTWDDYKWCEGSDNTLTKYCSNSKNGKDEFTDNLTVLLPEDDACTVNMCGSWRMPTINEFQKLNSLCNNEWVTNYNGVDGLNGRLFKLKTDESKQLFFPASGYCSTGSVYNVRVNGMFWSSSLYVSNPCRGFLLSFHSSSVNASNYGSRYYGYPIIGFLGSIPAEKYLPKSEAKKTYATKEEIDSLVDKTRVSEDGNTISEMIIEDFEDENGIEIYTKQQVDDRYPKFWYGSQEEFNELDTKDPKTMYFITV